MPKCAIKKHCMAYSVFTGAHTAESVLPNWLKNAYDVIYEDEYRYWVTDQIKLIGGAELVPFSEVLIEGHDVFLRNFKGRVERIPMDLFDSELEIIADGTVAQKKLCYDYFIYSTEMGYEDYGDEERSVIDIYHPNQKTVFIKQDEDVYIKMPYYIFTDRYYFLGSGIDWNKFYE